MIRGYYIRQDGERWSLIEQDAQYRESVVLDGIPYERAVKLYWRYMRQWIKDQSRRGRQPEPMLFPMREDARPPSHRLADGRYREPMLFDNL